MHYYQFNIADYRKDTRHLTQTEHYIYRELLDECYLSEIPLPNDERLLARKLLRTSDQIETLKSILNEFFTLESDGYHSTKADLVMGKVYEKSEKARYSANKRWERCERNANAMQSDSERNANGMLPNTQDPLPKDPKPITQNLKSKKQVKTPVEQKPDESLWVFNYWPSSLQHHLVPFRKSHLLAPKS